MPTNVRPRRSVLFMPGSNARAASKARSLPTDALVLDLEDAVAPEAKADAREQIAATLKEGGFGPREVVVRTNAPDTPWFEADLAFVARASAQGAGPDAVLVPKISDPETLIAIGRRLDALGAASSLRVWAMIETPMAVLKALDIALASRNPVTRLAVLALGTNDLSKETGTRIVPGRAPMLSWLSHCVLAARAGGRRHPRCRVEQFPRPRRLRAGMRAGGRARLRRQDADPSQPDRGRATPPSRPRWPRWRRRGR